MAEGALTEEAKAGAERMDTREDGCLCALPMRRGVRPLSSVNIVPKKLRRVKGSHTARTYEASALACKYSIGGETHARP
eukprot:CAMPEP_0181193060 /NCGR_PEP_ID=MMETSP1096-20121128/13616_1 /TAXON_ID=156174 ORGANISM="Chrysochromulina ericina, Strain CCMP281" /NCGR_SAMPLE_ID=MMETSP1096 /ASSEMBLY_ACC=CAM_ASM_000453 /LENGTH=78 /DNA_ID=CAMNT_0023282499 /DNA_START=572 /DNA_END=806 /DNA_ORIENTATION=-